LIVNIHGETKHAGKQPKRSATGTDQKTDLIRLRREMKEAVQQEDYERASELRDQIKKVEEGSRA
jgi:protein arginine kinase activator